MFPNLSRHPFIFVCFFFYKFKLIWSAYFYVYRCYTREPMVLFLKMITHFRLYNSFSVLSRYPITWMFFFGGGLKQLYEFPQLQPRVTIRYLLAFAQSAIDFCLCKSQLIITTTCLMVGCSLRSSPNIFCLACLLLCTYTHICFYN